MPCYLIYLLENARNRVHLQCLVVVLIFISIVYLYYYTILHYILYIIWDFLHVLVGLELKEKIRYYLSLHI